MRKRLYVRNLGPQIDSIALENMFTSVADVESVVVRPMPNQAGALVGYVEMLTEQGARDCIDRFNGHEKDGFVLIVTEDIPHVPKPHVSSKKKKLGVRKAKTQA